MRPIDWLAVTILLLFAAGLRIVGISYGQLNPAYFPSYAPFGMAHEQLPIQPDEVFNVSIPVNMVLRNQRNPEFFNYPSLIINTNYLLYQLTGALDGQSLDLRRGRSLRAYAEFSLYVFSRMYSVFGGMLQVACAYAILRLAASRYAALCAGLLVAVSYTLVQHAHYIKPGSLAAGWMMLAAWSCFAALYASRSGQRTRLWLLAGVATGLAATTRYNALAVAPLLCVTGLILLRRHQSRRGLRLVLGGWLLAPLVFFVGSPYILRDFEHFWRDFSQIVGQYTLTGAGVADYFLVDHMTGFGYLVMYAALFAIGLPALALAALSPVAALADRRRSGRLWRNSLSLFVLLIATVVILYALVALRTVRPGHSDQLLILILPFLALLSAVGADWLVNRLRLPTLISMPLVALLLVIQPLALSIQVVNMFTQPDTRQVMLEWIHDNILPGARFFLNGPYNVPLDEAIYPNQQQFVTYAPTLPDAASYDYMVYSDALAFDILRSQAIVPAEVVSGQREYLRNLDATFERIAEIEGPHFAGSEAIMNMASYWHNPTLILYCVNAENCASQS